MVLLGVILSVLAIALIVVGVLAWAEKLPGNPIIGIHVPEVRKSQELWNAAHKVAGPLWIVAGLALGVAALLIFDANGWLWFAIIFAMLASLVLLGIGASFGAKTVAVLDAQQAQAAAAPAPEPDDQPRPKVDVDKLRNAMYKSQDDS